MQSYKRAVLVYTAWVTRFDVGDLIVMDTMKKHGTLSGGEAKVGAKVECVFWA